MFEAPDNHHYENVSGVYDQIASCVLSGTCCQVNQSYKNNCKSHGYEDTSFRLSLGEDSLYAVLDGHDGSRVAHFARETLIREYCSLIADGGDVNQILEQCITNVDRRLHEGIMPLLEERASIKVKIAQFKNSFEAFQAYPRELERLGDIEDQIKGGTTVAMAVVHDNKLYVCNVGDSRVVLVSYVPAGEDSTNIEFKIDQLTEDHTTANDRELDRLSRLGLDRQEIQKKRRVGSMETTRAIGDFAVKWGYKDFDILSAATGPPVISTPYVTPEGIQIDKSIYFMFLMSDGVYHAVEEMSDCSVETSPDPNLRVANLIHEQFKQHADCQRAAQNVLEYICKSHYDSYSFGCSHCCRRDDMTLIVRLFNNPSKLYGHKRNHSGTIFRSSFSFCSTGSPTTPQPRTTDIVDMISNLNTPSKYSMPPLTLTNTENPLHCTSPIPTSPSPTSPSQVVFDPDEDCDEPYIKVGPEFPDDLVMSFIKQELGLPDNIRELLDKQNLD